jgi:prepilin-type N-terminal cleavage/methylation domain-containing protein
MWEVTSMLKKLRKNKKGFTLAELLIVVAIIGVLVAISIPIFTSQLTKARRATNQANARAAYAEASADLLTNDKTSAEATTAPAQSTGKFDSITSAPSWFTNYSDFSVTKGKAFKVTVTDAGAVTVEQE